MDWPIATMPSSADRLVGRRASRASRRARRRRRRGRSRRAGSTASVTATGPGALGVGPPSTRCPSISSRSSRRVDIRRHAGTQRASVGACPRGQSLGFRVSWRSPRTSAPTLQLLLERGQTYGDLATLLGQEESEVRARARAALTELGGADPDRNVGLTDYLLGQADPIGRADASRHLRDDPDDRQLASELCETPARDVPDAPSCRGFRASRASRRRPRPPHRRPKPSRPRGARGSRASTSRRPG